MYHTTAKLHEHPNGRFLFPIALQVVQLLHPLVTVFIGFRSGCILFLFALLSLLLRADCFMLILPHPEEIERQLGPSGP